ncbi:molybdopterin molybdotransferase MoeA [Roseixanthobacter glucoisosaccharinicivorans]|uniref:molybdopterin molybdotransferase MoeA n=1 Tax=Roseixanthobacter glucoisosaccharinicivorans TaxID=3119923 RepID=UPI00372CE51B
MALMPVEEALALVVAGVAPLSVQSVPVDEATGRVLAADLWARRSQPAADMSAMDGYAVAAADIAQVPATLRVIGESAAGRPFAGALARGEAVRIFTGALLPTGADTVVIQENIARDGDLITTTAATAPLRNVRKAGFDFPAGSLILPAGRRLTDRDVMLAAAADHSRLDVVARPKVGILQTGDELVRPGDGGGALSDVVVSNVYGLAALARAYGAEAVDLGLVGDSLDATRAAIRAASESGLDVLITSGGASVGEHDLIAPALRAEGVALTVHRIALRPGKPLMFGARGGMRVLGLPGNPVSAYVGAVLFLVPLLNALQRAAQGQPLRAARLGCPVKANDSRVDYMRATLSFAADGALVATPLPIQDSSMLTTLAMADCLLIRPAFAPAGATGDPCSVLQLPS